MKKILMAVGAMVIFAMGGVVGVLAQASPTPEINRANATFQFSGNLASKTCVGEDGIGYITFTGSYSGGETRVTPDATDYVLTGNLSITGVAWTINARTGRGVLTGKITLINNTTGAATYAGILTLITQGVPTATGGPVPGRGWINAKFAGADDGVTTSANDDSLLANVEFKLSPTSGVGQFGDLAGGGTLGFKDFSVVTNVAPLAQDGHC